MSPSSTCELCGLASSRPITRAFDNRELLFCCVGCMNVYAILLESGVVASGQSLRDTEVFRRSLELGLISNPASNSESQIEIETDAPTSELLLQISGMWCSSCSWLIERAVRSLPGVKNAEVFFASDLAKIRYCPQYLPPGRVTSCIQQLGYQATEYVGDTEPAKAEMRSLLVRLGVAAFLWSNIMACSTILYVGYFEQISPSISRLMPFLLLILTTPLVFYCAWPILRAAALGLRAGQLRMESLLSLGILAAYGYSTAQAFRGETRVYFDTAAALVTLVLAGKLIERSAKQRAARSIAMLYRLMPKKIRLLSGGIERFVAIDALEPGEIFVVKAGERIPADGIIVEGETHTDESLLTGEAAPVSKKQGSQVASGSLNIGGVIHVRATRVGADSALAQIIRLVENALSSRAPIERTVDKISRTFIPVVIATAIIVLAIGLATHSSTTASIMRAISILVIACPCALGLATPLAITAAVGTASERGILVSDSRVLEALWKIDTVVLDKTGTVTEGDFRLVDWSLLPAPALITAAGAGVSSSPSSGEVVDAVDFEHDYLPLLGSLEFYSEHPLGAAVVNRAHEAKLTLSEANEVKIHKGQGISGVVNGHRIFIGNRQFAQLFAPASDCFPNQDWRDSGQTVTFFGWDGELKGTLAFGDRIKPEARQLVAELKRRNLEVEVLSGDAPYTTAAVARWIGADGFIAEATPAGKVRVIEKLQQERKRVAMIGDGINDAPALAQADLGIALGSGTDIAMKASAVVLMGGSLLKVLEAFSLSEHTSRIVRQNLFWAFFYNALGITLAVAGILTPIWAAGAMLLSSASVVGNSMRLTR